jgi:hypothetical protein
LVGSRSLGTHLLRKNIPIEEDTLRRTTSFKRFRRCIPVILMLTSAIAALVPSGAHAGRLADEVSRFDSEAGDAVRQIEPLLSPAEQITRALPADPQQAVIDRTAELSAALGFPQDPTLQFQTANLPDEIAGRLANVVQDLIACNAITQQHYSELRDRMEEIATTGGGLNSSDFADIDACALSLWTSTTELERANAADPSLCGSPHVGAFVDVWPVLRYDGLCLDNLYQNDYLLIVDAGGNDTYMNNAGSNMVDVNFSPPTSLVPGVRGRGPARGCQRAIPGLAAADCVPAVAVVLDMRGNDTFGVKQTPDHDRGCTADLLIRRMVTVGVGFLGVGILRDAGGGSDKYTGKTGAVGAGHIFGVGILSDSGGNDTYSAVRNSQGFALVGGVGILNDESGNDNYGFYMPSPLNPAALNQQEGAGGVRDDEGEGLCDRIPRFTLGAANVLPGTIALFLDDSGGDNYHGAFAEDFVAPAQIPSTKAGSLGFGNNQGIGIFVDRGATSIPDTYLVEKEPGCARNKLEFSTRDNGVVLPPGIECTGDGGGTGLFIDQ